MIEYKGIQGHAIQYYSGHVTFKLPIIWVQLSAIKGSGA